MMLAKSSEPRGIGRQHFGADSRTQRSRARVCPQAPQMWPPHRNLHTTVRSSTVRSGSSHKRQRGETTEPPSTHRLMHGHVRCSLPLRGTCTWQWKPGKFCRSCEHGRRERGQVSCDFMYVTWSEEAALESQSKSRCSLPGLRAGGVRGRCWAGGVSPGGKHSDEMQWR